MEITGLECSHTDCTKREWIDGPTAQDWLTVQLSSVGENFHAKVHYCPEHGKGLVRNSKIGPQKLNTGQQRILNPAHIDENLTAALTAIAITPAELDAANERDLTKAGLAVPTPAPVSAPDITFEGVGLGPSSLPSPDTWAAAVSGEGPATQPIATVNDHDVTPGGTPKVRRRRGAGVIGALVPFLAVAMTAVTQLINFG